MPQKPGTHRLACTVRVDGKPLKLPYVLFLPDGYKAKGPKTPVLLFLHGLGETGTDLDAIFYHGPNFELEKQGNTKFRKEFPMIVISPQCPPRGQRWDRGNMDQYINALLDQILPQLNVDLDRVYATGLSMGGLGTRRVAATGRIATRRSCRSLPTNWNRKQPPRSSRTLRSWRSPVKATTLRSSRAAG